MAEPTSEVTPWHWRDLLDVESVLSPSAASAHHSGLPLLLAAVGLLVLVLAGGSTLRMLGRMDERLRTG